jgi:uncharacterized protein YyaL (SSP411 family)
MTYIQATHGGGGWPMSVFLTPDLHPFFGGTYFPPQDAYGRPGFKTVLQRISEVWRTRREEVSAQSADVMRQLAEMSEPEVRGGGERQDRAGQTLSSCFTQLEGVFPKIPHEREASAAPRGWRGCGRCRRGCVP